MTILADFDQCVLDVITETVGPGFNGTYTTVSTGTYDPSTGSVTTAEVDIPVKLLMMDLTRQSNGFGLKSGTEIQAGDKECYMIPPIKTGGPALVIDPANDVVSVAGLSYSIVTFKEINPSGTDPVLYTFYLRR